jgi:hypothetical protein
MLQASDNEAGCPTSLTSKASPGYQACHTTEGRTSQLPQACPALPHLRIQEPNRASSRTGKEGEHPGHVQSLNPKVGLSDLLRPHPFLFLSQAEQTDKRDRASARC